MSTFLDTWLGGNWRDGGGNVRSDKAPTYADVRLPADPIERGAPEANPPKAVEAKWMIGFKGGNNEPVATLRCSCGTVTDFELGGTGVAPLAKCCKNAPGYPQDRKHTAHLLATKTVPDGTYFGRLAQPGIPPEIGLGPGLYPQDLKYKPGGPRTGDGLSQAEIVALTKAEELGLAGAAKDAEVVEAARREHEKHLK